MEAAASGNAALLRRIVQLENERDDLRRDVEMLCMQQSEQSSGGATDVVSRLQARRLASLEQELESYKQKMLLFKRESENLQEELSEVYRIKTKFADMYKAESEKNQKLEEETKFFRSNVAVAFAERDRLTLELEKSRQQGAALEDELRACNLSRAGAMRTSEENFRRMDVLHENLERLKTEAEVYHQVIKKFWTIRHDAKFLERTEPTDMATSLLADPGELWCFGSTGKMNRELKEKVESLEATNGRLQEEVCFTRTELTSFRETVYKEAELKRDAQQTVAKLKEKLAEFVFSVSRQLDEVKALVADLREYLDGRVTKEVSSLAELCQKAIAKCLTTADNDSCSTSASNDVALSREETTVSQEAFLQVLQEKVGALLLLSQQEERHLLEGKKIAALESQSSELNRRLAQVTQEKVEALLKVAELKFECQQLEDRERELLKLLHNPSPGGRLLPANWAKSEEIAAANATPKSKQTKSKQSRRYIRSWLTGVDLSISHEETSLQVARSKVESAALQERVASLRQLLKAGNRLKTSLAEANENQDAEEQLHLVDGVIAEAQRLKTALSCTLPVSSTVEDSITISTETNDDKAILELVSAAGTSLVEVLVLAGNIQRRYLSPSSELVNAQEHS